MKRSNVYILVLIAGMGITFPCCDTSRNVPNPEKSYFLKFYGGSGAQTGVDVALNPDGTFILLGTTQQTSSSNILFFLVKADAYGNVIWERTFGGSPLTQAKDVELTSDGGIVVVGDIADPNPIGVTQDHNIFIKTLTTDGIGIDSMNYPLLTLPDSTSGDEYVNSVTQTSDGGFIVAGYSGNVVKGTTNLQDAIFVRFTNNPLAIYTNTWTQAQGTGYDNITFATKVIQVSDSLFDCFGYSNAIISGTTGTNFNYWMVTINSGGGGGIVTIPLQPETSSKNTRLGSVAQSGSTFFLGGVTSSNTSDLNLDIVTQNATDGSLSTNMPEDLLFTDLKTAGQSQTSLAVSGSSIYFLANEATTGNSNILLTKLNTGGSLVWGSPVIYGGAGDDYIGAVNVLPNGRVIIVGTMATGTNDEPKMVLMKVNENGQFAN